MKNILKIILILTLFASCKKENKNDVLSNEHQDNNVLFLDKNAIDLYFKSNPERKNIIKEVEVFYENRNLKFAWFTQKGLTQAVPNFQNQLQNYDNDFHDKSLNIAQLDTLITVMKTNKNGLKIDAKQRENLELKLTTTFFKYSEKAYSGAIKNIRKLDWFIPKTKRNYQVLLDSLVLKDANDAIHEPVSPYYTKLKSKLRLYRDIKKNGGFPIIKTNKEFLAKTESDSILINVKKRLFVTGDLKANDNSIMYTTNLANAISNFQQRVGLPENGKLNFKTIAELNKTVDFRIRQILINLERLRWIPAEIENDYLLVNIPEYKLHIFENKKLIWEANVVVGKEGRETTIFKGNMSQIVLNPYWNIPRSIIIGEIIPKMKSNTNYLNRNNMEVVSGGKVVDPSSINWQKYSDSFPYDMRQKPGNDNSLGKMKFLFPNSYSIYLHDTPSKELFSRNERDFSHGCIRVENPKKLALYLLRKNKSWTSAKVDAILATSNETTIALVPKIPVYITYFTAWVDSNGNLNFRNDIYDLDDALAKEIFAD